MSRKNSAENKKLRRLARAINKDPLPTYFDVVQWLKDRRIVSTGGEALAMQFSGRIKADGITLGTRLVDDEKGGERLVPERFAPTSLRDSIEVLDAEAVSD